MKRWFEMVPQRSAVCELLESPHSQYAAVAETGRPIRLAALTPPAQERKPRPDMERTRRRSREWRRRALFRKGARLQSLTAWTDDFASLAMLDEDGMVIAWYARESQDADQRSPINQHVSCLYTPQDAAIGVPVRDLCSATIHRACTTTGWRVGIDGRKFWATTTIRSVLLRDGRLQGFSHVMHRKPAPWRNLATTKLLSWNHSPAVVRDQSRNLLARCRDALSSRHLPAALLVFATAGIGANSTATLPDNAIASHHEASSSAPTAFDV